jgi:hypothetical protein
VNRGGEGDIDENGHLKAATAAALEKEPRVQGASTQPQLSIGLRATLDAAAQPGQRIISQAFLRADGLDDATRARGLSALREAF